MARSAESTCPPHASISQSYLAKTILDFFIKETLLPETPYIDQASSGKVCHQSLRCFLRQVTVREWVVSGALLKFAMSRDLCKYKNCHRNIKFYQNRRSCQVFYFSFSYLGITSLKLSNVTPALLWKYFQYTTEDLVSSTRMQRLPRGRSCGDPYIPFPEDISDIVAVVYTSCFGEPS